jgi:hypothetical protein
MPIGTQFSGILLPGQYQEWVTTNWPLNWFVVWSVRPSPGFAFPANFPAFNVTIRAITVQSVLSDTGPSLDYNITVWNVGALPVPFDVLYNYTEF